VTLTGVAANGAVIECNTFQQNGYGLYLSNAFPTIQSNNFIGNTTFGLYNGYSAPVTAENNWWGDAAGPNQAGDKTHGNVDYDPWSTVLIQCAAGGSNNAPYSPAGPQPADNAVRVTIPSTGLILTWSGGDPDPLDTVTYDLYRGPSAENLSLLAFNITGATYKMTDLQRGLTYYWKVIARDNRGLQTEGPVWRFTAMGDIPDLIVAGLTTAPAGHLQPGQSVTLTAQIRNIGTGPVVDPFSVSFKAGGATIGSPAVSDIVPAGATVLVSQPWTCTTGDPSLEVMADDQRKVSETNEQNNQFTALLSEVADNTPPALVANAPANGAYLQQFQQFTVTLADSQSAIDKAAVMASFSMINSQYVSLYGVKTEANGTFTFAPAGLPLADDTYRVAIIAADVHGNTKLYNFSFTIDTHPPAKPVITGGTVTSGTIRPRPEQNSYNQFVAELTGTREAGTNIWINGSQVVGFGDANWSTPVTLQPGANAIEVWLLDRAGNRSSSEWVDIAVAPANAIEYEYNAAGRTKQIRPAAQQQP
jgi:parallel beta-helix repeat protein